ncbi:MAG: hypothetical protein GY844_06120 [Bradyrhizobium sp.]|nr:hypothetical protein [Bradyrhizobium sp.]
MLIANTGQSLVVMNLRTGEQVQLPPGQMTPVLDSKIPFIDDSFVLISLFNAGVLVAYTDAGAAYPGFPTTANPADSKRIPPVDADYAAAVVVAGGGKGQGYRTVLFGDSMTDTYETVSVPTTVSYDSVTGIATVTFASHQQATGWYVYIWNRNYSSTLQGWRRSVTRIDANTFTVQLPTGLAGVPASAATWLIRSESWRSAQGFVTWLQAASGQRFDIIYNGALSGDTTGNALSRLNRDCLAYRPQVVMMQMLGINDTSPGNGNIAEDAIYANQTDIINQITLSGATLVLLTTTPVASSEPAGRATLTNMSRVNRLNSRLREYCKGKPGVILVDVWKQVVNPLDSTGLAAAALLRTTDKIHYSMRGARAIGEYSWNAIKSVFPSDNSTLPVSTIQNLWAAAVTLTSVTRSGGIVTGTSASHGYQVGERVKLWGGSESFNEYVTITAVTTNTISFVTASGSDGAVTGTIRISRSRNLVPNCILATASGGGVFGSVTGSAAANIRVNSVVGTPTAVASVVSRSDGYGNNQRVVVTPAASGDQVMITSDFTTYQTDLPPIVAAGREYVFECDLSLSGVSGSNLGEIRVNMTATVGGVQYQTFGANGFADGPIINTDVAGYHFKTAPFRMPSGAVTQVQWQVLLGFTASGGAAVTLEVGRLALWESETVSP